MKEAEAREIGRRDGTKVMDLGARTCERADRPRIWMSDLAWKRQLTVSGTCKTWPFYGNLVTRIADCWPTSGDRSSRALEEGCDPEVAGNRQRSGA